MVETGVGNLSGECIESVSASGVIGGDKYAEHFTGFDFLDEIGVGMTVASLQTLQFRNQFPEGIIARLIGSVVKGIVHMNLASVCFK